MPAKYYLAWAFYAVPDETLQKGWTEPGHALLRSNIKRLEYCIWKCKYSETGTSLVKWNLKKAPAEWTTTIRSTYGYVWKPPKQLNDYFNSPRCRKSTGKIKIALLPWKCDHNWARFSFSVLYFLFINLSPAYVWASEQYYPAYKDPASAKQILRNVDGLTIIKWRFDSPA